MDSVTQQVSKIKRSEQANFADVLPATPNRSGRPPGQRYVLMPDILGVRAWYVGPGGQLERGPSGHKPRALRNKLTRWGHREIGLHEIDAAASSLAERGSSVSEACDRLWARIQKTDTCWNWMGALTSWGYGQIYVDGKNTRPHRLAWEVACGSIPDGMMVLHTCDNRKCCRNDDEGFYEVGGVRYPRRGHLWLGTQAANMADKVAKGRQAKGDRVGTVAMPWLQVRGESHPAAKLTEREAAEIRSLFASGSFTKVALGERFGVSSSTIYNVVMGRVWKHIEVTLMDIGIEAAVVVERGERL